MLLKEEVCLKLAGNDCAGDLVWKCESTREKKSTVASLFARCLIKIMPEIGWLPDVGGGGGLAEVVGIRRAKGVGVEERSGGRVGKSVDGKANVGGRDFAHSVARSFVSSSS